MKKITKSSKWFLRIAMLLMMLAAIPAVKPQEANAATHAIQNVTVKAQVKASATNAISIKWNKTSYATKYAIFRKTPTQRSYKRIANVSASTSYYLDKNLDSSQEYIYAVRAFRKVGTSNVYSKFTPVSIATRPTKTTVTAVASSSSKVTVSWTAVDNVSGYRVYRKLYGGSWKALKNVAASKTSYTDSTVQAGKKYIYCVRPYKLAGNKMYASALCKSSLLQVPTSDSSTTYAKLTAAQKDVMKKILYAVETGGQVYGNQDYADFTEAYTNSSAEHAITIGAGQWYGTEAQRLLKLIYATDPDTFKSIDTYGYVWKAVCNEDWSTYKISASSGRAIWIKRLISSSVGIKCQDQLMYEQIEEYEAEIRKLGITEPKAVCMFINIRHQGGYGAVTRVLAKTTRPVTLDNIYKALQTDTGNQVGAYKTRQSKIYSWLNTYM